MILGITGRAGSGKTYLCSFLAKNLPIQHLSLDHLGHHVLEQTAIIESIRKTFGNQVFINGKINRKMLGEIVFSNIIKLNQLNDIIHPALKKKFISILQHKKTHQIYIIDGALLFQLGLSKYCKYIFSIRIEENTTFHLTNRLKNIVSIQPPPYWYDERSHFVLKNNFSKEFLKKSLKMISALLKIGVT